MSNAWWICKRDLGALLRSPIGYVIIFAVLIIDGLLFNAWAVGSGARKSSEVLEIFFYCASGSTMLASVFVGMRLIAEERQTGTLALLATSPVREWQLVLGKFSSAMLFLSLMTALTLYMPLLIMVNGRISLAHIIAGYVGVLLLGATSLALVLLASALAPNQLVAAVLGAAVVVVFLLMWLLSRIASPPLEDVLAYLSIHDKHFRPFQRGIISTQDVIFYLSFTYVALLMATRALEARRWR